MQGRQLKCMHVSCMARAGVVVACKRCVHASCCYLCHDTVAPKTTYAYFRLRKWIRKLLMYAMQAGEARAGPGCMEPCCDLGCVGACGPTCLLQQAHIRPSVHSRANPDQPGMSSPLTMNGGRPRLQGRPSRAPTRPCSTACTHDT